MSGTHNPAATVDICGDYRFIEDFIVKDNPAFVGVCKFVKKDASATISDRVYIDNRLYKRFRIFDSCF